MYFRMSDIAVYHPILDTRGGGEAVCLRTIEAIQDDHDVTIYSLNSPNLDKLNEYFNTSVESVELRSLGIQGELIKAGGNLIYDLTSRPTRRLQGALSYPYVDNRDHDLVFSTYNEFGFESPAVQYIDFPNFGPNFESEPEGVVERIYGNVCNMVYQGSDKDVQNSKLLVNSGWSADIVENVYGVRPEIVYPPVDTSVFNPRPWDERENGFVSIGRADPVKRPLKMMRIIEQLVNRGHDVHLHWIGSVGDTAYGEKVRKYAAEIDEVTLEERVPFAQLTEMVSTHKYGLHGRVNEHFGIAVAEILAGGALPFVHNSGGPREIVGEMDDVLYQDVDEAVSKIVEVMEGSNGNKILRDLPDAEEMFGLKRFRRNIKASISDKI